MAPVFAEAQGLLCMGFFLALVIGGPALYRHLLLQNNPGAWEAQERVRLARRQQRWSGTTGLIGTLLKIFLGGR